MAMQLTALQVKVLKGALATFKDLTLECIRDYERSGLEAHKPEIAEMREEIVQADVLQKLLYEWTIT
ncbi:MAG: hypothetical protein AB7L09_21435 [Nitrospira sp.]